MEIGLFGQSGVSAARVAEAEFLQGEEPVTTLPRLTADWIAKEQTMKQENAILKCVVVRLVIFDS